MAPPVGSQAFGRFGFNAGLDLPNLLVSREGIIAKNPMADQIRFTKPLNKWNRLTTSEFGQTMETDGGVNCPIRVAANLLSPGVAMEFRSGMSFGLGSTLGPILSWTEGSCNPGVPTPALSWVLVSFHDAQPPFLLCLSGGQKAVFKIAGGSGDWRLTTEAPYQGWVRIVYPLGTEGRATRNAADLGKLVEEIKPDLPLWTASSAEFKKIEIKPDDFGLEVTWRFSGAALVPPPVLLAPLGGYPLKLLSEVRHTHDRSEMGGSVWAPSGVLKLRFPVRQVPPGRPVAYGGTTRPLPGTVSYIDLPSIVDLAMEALRGDRDSQTLTTADAIEQAYLEHASSTKEPATQQNVFYDSDNRGLDVLAAHSLLNAVVSSGAAATPDTALFTTAVWRRDWWTWLPVGPPNQREVRRIAGLLAVAGAIFATDDARLQGAMFEAGLAAERGRHYLDKKFQLTEVLSELRAALFATRTNGPEANQVLSRVRVLSGQTVWATQDLETVVLHFPSPTETDRMLLWLPADCTLTAGLNLRILTQERQKESLLVQIVADHAGESTLRIHGLGTTPFVHATKRVAEPDLVDYRELLR